MHFTLLSIEISVLRVNGYDIVSSNVQTLFVECNINDINEFIKILEIQ